VAEVDHEFIRSIYAYDPDGNLVEWTYDTRPLTEADKIKAHQILEDDTPATEGDYEGPFTRSTVTKFRAPPKPLPIPSVAPAAEPKAEPVPA
jgi:catechol-2,3-dioxygenase